MIYHEFAKGNKDIGLIISPKLYSFTNFIGSSYGIPIKKYVDDFAKRLLGISTCEPDGKKPTKAVLKTQVADILDSCATMGIDKLIVANSDYFKYLSGEKEFESNIGQIFKCAIEGYEYITVIPMINASVINAQPNKKPLLDKAIDTVGKFLQGTYEPPKEHQFESYSLAQTPEDAKSLLYTWLDEPHLACDIETTGLRVGESEVLTIAFAKDKYNAFTIACHETYGVDEEAIVGVIKDFFKDYKGKLIFHNALFDVKQIVYDWFMGDVSNHKMLYEGLDVIEMPRVADTMLMAFADLNSTERPQLGLKVLAKDFLGNYAEDVTNCLAVKLEDLAYYNSKDVVGTIYVYEKFKHQEDSRIYTEILQPSLEYLIHEMINGLPIDMPKVDEAIGHLKELLSEAESNIKNNRFVMETEENLNILAARKYNETHKVKKKVPEEMGVEFNPNSANQLRILLFDVMGFEPVEFTDTGAPKTDRASIKEFISQLPEDDEKLEILNALKVVSETAIIINTFLEAFKELSIVDASGNYTINGNHRLGGTMSGRLSSNSPNMSNMPSNSIHAKSIKKCIVAPDGWLFAFADYNSLEDRISTLLTGDPMKLKEVAEGYEGHSLRSSFYFKDELEARGLFIDQNDKDSVNRIKDEAPDLRQQSKGVTFLKIYGGGAGKIQKVLKCSMERAQSISDAFDELYKVTKKFNDDNIALAKKQGYLDVAFGLRVKCPRINSNDSNISSSEGRSINNASTQSYGMLTNKASIMLLERIKTSEFKYNIKMVNQIHDCIYLLCRDEPEVVKWLNDNLIECMRWKDDPALEGPVPMEAELDIGRSWASTITVKNNISVDEIKLALSEI